MVHLPFADRQEAGQLLAAELALYKCGQDAVVLALTRGGVPVGFEVADRLHLPLDILVARKLGVPWQPELAMGAIAGDTRVLDEGMIGELQIPHEEVEAVTQNEQAEMNRLEALYRGGQPPLPVAAKVVFLIDDGLATGSTLRAASRHVRSLHPARLIIGVPVGAAESCSRLREEADELVCLARPLSFKAVSEWYLDFSQVSDDTVRRLLADYGSIRTK